MIRRLLPLVSALLLISFAVAPAAPVPTHLMPKDPPLAFPTRVGTTWVYDGAYGKLTIVISAVKEAKDGAKLVTTEIVGEDGKRTPHMVQRISAAGIFVVSEAGENYTEPWCFLKLPHRPGRTWETKLDGRALPGTGTMTAGPVEKVKVPLGEFSAARADWHYHFKGGGGLKATYWYADGVGLVQMNDKQMLKSFTLGKD
jgi:hypothetical protein